MLLNSYFFKYISGITFKKMVVSFKLINMLVDLVMAKGFEDQRSSRRVVSCYSIHTC